MIKIQKGKPIIDQHDKNYLYAGKFGGNFVPETLKKPIEDLTKLFSKLRRNKKFIMQSFTHSFVSMQAKNISLVIPVQAMLEKCSPWLLKNLD